MKRYFDITDLIQFAKANGAVSGIQRVQIRVLRHLAAQGGPDDVLCLFASGPFSRLRGCRAGDLFTDESYDAARLLARLGVEGPDAAFTRRELYEHLSRYPRGSLRRGAEKASLAILAQLAPDRARARMGLPPRSRDRPADLPRIDTFPVRRLQTDDHLVLIGASWNVPEIEAVARRHGRRGGRVTQVVYDLIPYRHPEYFVDKVARKFTEFLVRSTGFVSQYVCISAATARDMRDFLAGQGSTAGVAAWPLAHEFEGYPRNERTAVPTDADLTGRTGRPFVLCVGTIEIRKNGIALLRAWQRLLAELGDAAPALVFAGKYGWKIDPFRELLESDGRLQRHVVLFPRPTDADLASLYERCLFTAYPSFVEGWGLPVGEAAWFGKYSVVSSSSSLPEVCGELVDYFDPRDDDGLLQALRRAVTDGDYRRRKEQAIREAGLRTWRDVALQLGVLLAGNRGPAPGRSGR
jgi:glycosyltransferase involved in cell wall biosynthesis